MNAEGVSPPDQNCRIHKNPAVFDKYLNKLFRIVSTGVTHGTSLSIQYFSKSLALRLLVQVVRAQL